MISVAWNVGQYKMSGPQITLPLIPNSIYMNLLLYIYEHTRCGLFWLYYLSEFIYYEYHVTNNVYQKQYILGEHFLAFS